jgi:hypothetical protein
MLRYVESVNTQNVNNNRQSSERSSTSMQAKKKEEQENVTLPDEKPMLKDIHDSSV